MNQQIVEDLGMLCGIGGLGYLAYRHFIDPVLWVFNMMRASLEVDPFVWDTTRWSYLSSWVIAVLLVIAACYFWLVCVFSWMAMYEQMFPRRTDVRVIR